MSVGSFAVVLNGAGGFIKFAVLLLRAAGVQVLHPGVVFVEQVAVILPLLKTRHYEVVVQIPVHPICLGHWQVRIDIEPLRDVKDVLLVRDEEAVRAVDELRVGEPELKRIAVWTSVVAAAVVADLRIANDAVYDMDARNASVPNLRRRRDKRNIARKAIVTRIGHALGVAGDVVVQCCEAVESVEGTIRRVAIGDKYVVNCRLRRRAHRLHKIRRPRLARRHADGHNRCVVRARKHLLHAGSAIRFHPPAHHAAVGLTGDRRGELIVAQRSHHERRARLRVSRRAVDGVDEILHLRHRERGGV